MILIGEPLLACDATGRLKNRIATVFLKTPGIVTQGSMHVLQRDIWLNHLNAIRAAQELPALTPEEELDELNIAAKNVLNEVKKFNDDGIRMMVEK